MGLLDVASNVLTLYKADTSDHKAKVKELTGLEKEQADQALRGAEARNKATDSMIDKLGKLGLAFNTVAQVAHAAFAGLEQYGHRLDLEAAAGTVSIDKLSKAASGLKTEMELLEHAAVFNKSAFQLTEEQMEIVERGMHALEERGKKSEEVWSAVSTALTKGTTKALEGLIGPIQKSSDAFDVNGDVIQTYGARAKAVDAILKQLAKTSEEAAEGEYDEADRIQSVTVRITDAMEHIKDSMGKMVVAMEPLIRATASLGEVAGNLFSKIAEGWQDIGDLLSIYGGKDPDEVRRRLAWRHRLDASDENDDLGADRFDQYLAQGGDAAGYISGQLLQSLGKDPNADNLSFNVVQDLRNAWTRAGMAADQITALGVEGFEKMKKRYAKAQELARQLAEERKKLANEAARIGGEELLKQLEDEDGGVSLLTWWAWHANVAISGKGRLSSTASRRPGADRWAGFVEDNRVTNLPGLSFGYDTGGTEGEFRQDGAPLRSGDQQAIEDAFRSYYGDYFKTGSATSAFGKMQADAYTRFQQGRTQSFLEQTFGKVEEFNVYKSAFDSLSDAVTSGFEAWITGSKSFAEAFGSALSKVMLGEAVHAAAQALKETAWGISQLATGNPAGAGHLLSAAKWTAAAIAFGAGAAAIGGGGAGGGAGAGASAPNVSGTTAPAPQTTQSIIVIGDSFAEDSPRMRQIRAERLVAMARGKNAVVYE